MQKSSTYQRTETITRFTITKPIISKSATEDHHDVRISLRDGRTISVPKSCSYRLHQSGVLEVNLEASTIYYAMGEWLSVKDINRTKLLDQILPELQSPISLS